MFRRRHFSALLLLLLTAVVLSACGVTGESEQAAISASVEATLTAVAANNAPQNAQAAQTTPSPEQQPAPTAASAVVLPPLVNGFDPAPRPASAKGDPNAPVIIYEWSDYT